MRMLSAALLTLACTLSASAELVLVEDGQPRAVIIVSAEAAAAVPKVTIDNPSPADRVGKVAWAAHDLQVYIEKISGAKLPILSDEDPAPTGTRILVGRSTFTAPYEDRIPSGMTNLREEEGYTILTDENTLVLAGNEEVPYRGTEYAVYFFLHKLGVRWYMPTEFGEFVPKQQTIRIGDIDEVSRPDFKMRNWWTHWFADDLRDIETRWKIRNGMNLERMNAVPGDSYIRKVLPPEAEKDNPEYADIFARDQQGNVYPHMPNLTSEASVQYAAEVIKAHFRKNPDVTSFGIGGDDGTPRDYSPRTDKYHMNFPSMLGRFNVAEGVSTTEEWMLWIQRVAAEVRTEFPDKFLTTNGYANRNTPPIGITPDPTIWIMFAAIFSDTYHSLGSANSWMTRRQYNMLKDWTDMYDNVYMYNYLYFNLIGCGAPPVPLARRHIVEMPLLKKLGVVGFWDEGRTVRGEVGIFPTYLRARLMWDADLDAQAATDDYFTNWYGPAAKPAFEFWDEMERAIEASIGGHNEDHILSLVFTPELIARVGVHLEKAEALAAGDPWAEPRVRADRATYEYLLAYKAMERAELDADWVEAAAQADRMNEVLQPAMDISRFYWDIETKKNKKKAVGQAHGFYYWGAVMRRDHYLELAAKTTGETGNMIAVLPELAKFSTDIRDDGRFDGWYRPDFDDSKWETMLTTKPFFAQGKYLDEHGFPYLGAIWYRLEVDVPAGATDEPASIHCMAAETEAWVWVNGKFVGHRPYIPAYPRPNAIDMDVTDALIPGQRNQVTVRLHTNYQPAQMAAGMASRLFLYSPIPPPPPIPVEIDVVSVGDPGNAEDDTGYGSVAQPFAIGKFEVTIGQYAKFLNAVAVEDDKYGLYHIDMWSPGGCHIHRAGGPGSYVYTIEDDRVNRPVNLVAWGDAARFCNWLHNGQPKGAQDSTSTEDGAYSLNGATSAAELMKVTRKPDAKWFIPTEDQWYKAAYYDPGGSAERDPVNTVYYDYPMGSDTVPSNDLVEPDPGNSGNFFAGAQDFTDTVDAQPFERYWMTEAGAFENSPSPYGTFDQGGNVFEWNETGKADATVRGVRGGGWEAIGGPAGLSSSFLYDQDPTFESKAVGFRVASRPAD